ncbi:hypothetical protein J113_02570 [Mycobacterium tuberculosis CAS/NITR204]|uniref:Peptidase M50 n=1 Tax=Mycobacterium tuberculosis CAS/NITR204 TaxID=1310114 RepID=R4M4X3_MYCTX|nr:hypothetical protein J113_02570 [Mycobacterium tuberculosis CAS/NITR204]
MYTAENAPGVAVLLSGDADVPGPLTGLPTHQDNLDTVIGRYSRLIVVGADADLGAVLTRLLRTDRLDVEVGYVPRRRSPATRAYRLPAGRRAARRARCGVARRVPLIRDETGSVIVGRAQWLPAEEQALIHGEAVVDDTVLSMAMWPGCAEPTLTLPGLRAAVDGAGKWRRWIGGRAAQLGTPVLRSGCAAPRPVRRSTFYRNVEGWLLVR